VTVALELPVSAAVVTLNVPEVADAAIASEEGTVNAGLVFDRAMLAPPAGPACDRVTVQVLDEFGPRLVGLQVSEDTSTGAPRATVILAELALYAAVIVALELVPMAPVVTTNVADVAAAATATDDGTVSVVLVFDKVRLIPPAGAACERVTVQVLEEFALIVEGAQASEETDSGPTSATTSEAATSM
jgi:hypothetical protein